MFFYKSKFPNKYCTDGTSFPNKSQTYIQASVFLNVASTKSVQPNPTKNVELNREKKSFSHGLLCSGLPGITFVVAFFFLWCVSHLRCWSQGTLLEHGLGHTNKTKRYFNVLSPQIHHPELTQQNSKSSIFLHDIWFFFFHIRIWTLMRSAKLL